MFKKDIEPRDRNIHHLSWQEWTALKQSIVAKAHSEQRQTVRDVLSWTARMAWTILCSWRRLRTRQEARRELSMMADRELRDICISRTGIEAAIRSEADKKSLR